MMRPQQQQQQQALCTPLLGDERSTVDDNKQYSEESQPSRLLEVNGIDDDDEEEEVMPLVLYLELILTFKCMQDLTQEQQDQTTDDGNTTSTTSPPPSMLSIDLTVVLFIGAMLLHRWTCIESKNKNSFLLLLPELWSNLVLSIFFYVRNINAAMIMLLVGTQVLSLLAFFRARSMKENNPKEEEEEERDCYYSLDKHVDIQVV